MHARQHGGPAERPLTIYARFGVRTLINARGNATLAGGTLMEPAVVEAMAEAARSFVRIADLEAAASQRISALTGAEAGYVTSGAAAGLTLGTAAILAGLDADRMDRLPQTDGSPDAMLVQRSHRNGYDHLVRSAGARLVEVGGPDGATADELEAAIDQRTAGVFFQGDNEPFGLPLATCIDIAHRHGLPVLVDGSMNLPPRSNLRRFIAEGADLVAFSGGKTVRGPQASGFLAGRADLLRSVALQHQDMDVLPTTWSDRGLLERRELGRIPQHGIGRSMKAGKEEIVGLLVALERYVERDEAAEIERWRGLADALTMALADAPGLTTRTAPVSPSGRPVPASVVTVDEAVYGRSAVDLVRSLADRDPIVMVDDHASADGVIRLDPENVRDDDVERIADAFRDLAIRRAPDRRGAPAARPG
jgi:L-seryl-tRNA(Ser) seleniumtransferase